MSVVGQPDLYLARSRTGSWDGPWDRLGCILDHARVPGHNQIGTEDSERGLEGPQLELPGPRGTGQKGHGTAVLGEDGPIHLVYQERAGGTSARGPAGEDRASLGIPA